ncbi:MAG: helix-turn-helix transcriptional regulator [Actinomycetota bacterium]
MTSKVERLVNLTAFLLDARRPVSADEIRSKLPGYGQESKESFKRMFERDKEELREMGIPVESVVTDPFEETRGYRVIPERYYLPDIDLTREEMAALWLAASLLRLPNPADARTALLKMGGGLPADPRTGLSWLAADVELSTPGLSDAFQALAERRTLTFDYRRSEGTSEVRTVDPYGLVHRKGFWYLVGRDHRREEVRSFRLDRVRGEIAPATPGAGGGEFEVPDGFRPEVALDRPPFVQGDSITRARVRFDSLTAWRIERAYPWLELDWQSQGGATAEVGVSDEHGFVNWVLLFGEGAEVVSPPALRALLLERLEEYCAGES